MMLCSESMLSPAKNNLNKTIQIIHNKKYFSINHYAIQNTVNELKSKLTGYCSCSCRHRLTRYHFI